MKVRPLHKNLDTGFVNLSALLRYLRQNSFVGLVRVDIGQYRAEMIFDESHRVRLREFERGFAAALNTEGESSGGLQRLLVRATSPGGLVSVFEAVNPPRSELKLNGKAIEPEEILDLDRKLSATESAKPKIKSDAKPEISPAPAKIPKPAENIFAVAKNGNGNGNGSGSSANGFRLDIPRQPQVNGNVDDQGDHRSEAAPQSTPPASSPAEEDIFPLYSHPVEVVEDQPEMKKKVSAFKLPDWEELISVTAALLGTTDDVLRSAGLGFSDAFNKARVEVSNEYPFLHTGKNIFLYADGKVILKEEIPPNLFVAGVCECLRRILNKLVSNPKFFGVYKHVTQQMLILVRQRQPQFDKFGYTRQLERVIKF